MSYRQIAETLKLSLLTVLVDFMHRSSRPLKDKTVKVLGFIRDPELL
jgi:hypothetical protein